MFEKPKKVEKTVLNDSLPPEKCDTEGCGYPCDIYIKKSNVGFCARHYQQYIDEHGLSSNMKVATKILESIKNGQ